jgi:phosphonate metabolism protein PhnN/1,5-bisphosphokinase (PRPP-forming)
MPRGTLFLIVGPSGAGKDTLINAARARLPTSMFVFPRRTITRSAGAGEDHMPIDLATFETRERSGAFALSWRAHGLAYGIDVAIVEALASGKHVVANVSRAIVAEARVKFDPVRVIEITASPATLAARLEARGREQRSEIEDRLSRRSDTPADITIVNDAALAQAVEKFTTALQG